MTGPSYPQDTGGAVFNDPAVMAEVAGIFRRGAERCGPDCEHHRKPVDDSREAS